MTVPNSMPRKAKVSRQSDKETMPREAAQCALIKIAQINSFESEETVIDSTSYAAYRDPNIRARSNQGNLNHMFSVLHESVDMLYSKIGPDATAEVRKFFRLQAKAMDGRFSISSSNDTPTIHSLLAAQTDIQTPTTMMKTLSHNEDAPRVKCKTRRSARRRRSAEAKERRRAKRKHRKQHLRKNNGIGLSSPAFPSAKPVLATVTN